MFARKSVRSLTMLLAGLALTTSATLADPQSLHTGEDLFLAALSATETLAAPRDVLAAGATVSLCGTVAQDTHASGVDAEIEAATGGSVYAAGANVTLRCAFGQDLTASGFTVRTSIGAVTGDVVFVAGDPRFGPAARIGATLRYYSGAPVEIPASVVAPHRVAFVAVKLTYHFRDMGQMIGSGAPPADLLAKGQPE